MRRYDRSVVTLHSLLHCTRVYCYNALMAKIKADAWKCDICGHVWLVGEMYPKQCAKCRTRVWNCDGVGSGVVVAESAQAPKVVATVELDRREWTPCKKHGAAEGFSRKDGWWCQKCAKLIRE